MLEIKRNRSRFWLKIYDDNPNSISINTNSITLKLIQCYMPELEFHSPLGWKKSTNFPDVYNLWLPNDCYHQNDIDDLIQWAHHMNKFIWLNTNRNTVHFFDGTELDFCLAYDWNFNFETHKRTSVGEAEYLLKYHPKTLTPSQLEKQISILAEAICDCIKALPVDLNEYIVTTIPAVEDKQNKLAWILAKNVAKWIGVPFVGITLQGDKPQMKELAVEDKILEWRKIYNDDSRISLPKDLFNQKVLVIDDLFQSGASLFCYAEFLKNYAEVPSVIAVTSVKAQKDGDNT